ncbi:unnamed protein product [Toxocara canis]|uniref:Secreted protein n=1 Tax=Toxocara canis TaxID=6265 RepID=A0A183URD0_TOXCA|nr:unnamed protein product [Toxocara canis]
MLFRNGMVSCGVMSLSATPEWHGQLRCNVSQCHSGVAWSVAWAVAVYRLSVPLRNGMVGCGVTSLSATPEWHGQWHGQLRCNVSQCHSGVAWSVAWSVAV